jgi:signal transduction histidine kinase
MTNVSKNWVDRQEAYWCAEGRKAAISQLVGTCWFVLICQFVFIGLDRLVFPDQFVFFASMRLVLNIGVLGVLLTWRFRYPDFFQIAIPVAVAFEILAMIYASQDSDSLYFAGLILVLVGTPVLQPISVRGSLLISSICIFGFVLCAAIAPYSVSEEAFVVEMIFILAAALESAVSCHALSVNRVVSFEQRREIEANRDQLASLDEIKTRFAANVHHELRTPLTLILAPLETLRSGELGELPDRVTRTLRTMHVNGQRLLKLINNLLDLAKLESDRFAISRSRTDIHSILGGIVEGARLMAERKGVSLDLEPRTSPCVAYVDIDALEKIAVNLLGNALKFTPEGGVVIASVSQPVGEEHVLLSIRDSGVGIAKENIARIFDRFAQVDGSSTREHEGTGIGLSLAKELVELHHGRVWAESEGIGHGTTMIVLLPIGEPDAPQSDAILESESDTALALDESLSEMKVEDSLSAMSSGEIEIASDLRRDTERWEARRTFEPDLKRRDHSGELSNIIVADDNHDMRELLELILGREFSVHLAQNGREALDLAKQVQVDLVVSDIMMPEMSGIELCRALKSDPVTSSVPVMLVSSKAENAMKVQGLELGADDYVTKPFHPKELLARARGLVRVRVLQRGIEEKNSALEIAMQDLKEAEQSLVRSERLAAIGELAAGVAHEVNNPVNFSLNAVRALRVAIAEAREAMAMVTELESLSVLICNDATSQVMKRLKAANFEETASTIDELGKIVSDGLERTHRLVSELREFATPTLTKHECVNLVNLIQSTASLLRPTLIEAASELEIDVSPTLPMVNGDPHSLNQVLLNLTKNAMEAIGTTGRIRIEAKEGICCVEIRVIDSGPGLSQEVGERIFEPFFTTKGSSGGTGLGLSICRKIAEDHGGQLILEAGEAGSTTFLLKLPLLGRGGL